MINSLNRLQMMIAAVSAGYVLLTVLVVLIANARSLRHWILPLLLQVLCINAFSLFSERLYQLSWLQAYSTRIRQAMFAVVIVLLNILVIAACADKKKPAAAAKRPASGKSGKSGKKPKKAEQISEEPEQPVPEKDLFSFSEFSFPEKGPEPESIPAVREEPQEISFPEIPATDMSEPEAPADLSDDKTLEEISQMMADGNCKDAVRYLRMIAFFAQEQDLRERASEMLEQYSTEEL